MTPLWIHATRRIPATQTPDEACRRDAAITQPTHHPFRIDGRSFTHSAALESDRHVATALLAISLLLGLLTLGYAVDVARRAERLVTAAGVGRSYSCLGSAVTV